MTGRIRGYACERGAQVCGGNALLVDRLEVDVDIGPVDDVVLPGCAVYVTVVVAVTVEVGKFKLMIVVIVVLKLIVVGLLTVLVTCTV